MESKNTLITIGILNRNGIKRLKKVIPSYLKQNYKNKEILIVDNGSTDGSLDYLKKYKEIKIIELKENKGYGIAKNILVKKSNGKYILMVDNDIELKEKDFIQKIIKEYSKIRKCAFLSPLVKDVDKNTIDSVGLYYNKLQKKINLKKIYGKGIIKIPGYMGNVVFFKKRTFLDLGLFDEIYPINIDDYDLSARAYLKGYNNYLTTNLLVIHHGIETRKNIKTIYWRNKYYFSGFSRMIWKNYLFTNILLWWPLSTIWIFYKSLKNSLKYFSFYPIYAYFISTLFFFRDFPNTLKLRKKIQLTRKTKKDEFLIIKNENNSIIK